MAYPSFNDDDFDLLKKIATNTAEMAEGGISANNPLLNGYRLAGSRTLIPYDMGAGTVIDVEKPDNIKSVTSNVALTFSNATPAVEKEFRLTLNADGTARTVTIPSSYSINRQGTITSVVVPASGTLILGFIYTGTRWNVIGDPAALPARQHFEISFDPKAVCDGAVDRLFMFKIGAWAPNGINILAWRLSFEADPTTEADLDLKRADAVIGVANAAVMDVCDTTNGVSSESTPANINGGATVANGQVIYLEFGAAYTEANHQILFEMEYSIA